MCVRRFGVTCMIALAWTACVMHFVVAEPTEYPIVYDEQSLIDELSKDEVHTIVIGADVVLTEAAWPGEFPIAAAAKAAAGAAAASSSNSLRVGLRDGSSRC